MKVIVFGATKGGTGKTTLAYNVAIEVAKKHEVLLADLGPPKVPEGHVGKAEQSAEPAARIQHH